MIERQWYEINEIIVHCSASDNPKHDDIAVIYMWHINRGFRDVGYNEFIRSNGESQEGRSPVLIPAHCRAKGKNRASIGICLHGMGGANDAQFETLTNSIIDWKQKYRFINKVSQHSDYDKRKPFCAGFTESQMRYLNGLIK